MQWFQGENQRAALQVNGSSGDFEGWVYGTGWKKWIHTNRTTGNVGIGTAFPDQKLTVKGKVHSEEVVIDLSVPAPDYVFEKDYKLPTLAETEIYIQQNKHLPEVPSAGEMEQNGIQVGEMNMLLLKKVEELTLYMIELKKENEEQHLEIEKLKRAVSGNSK